MKLYIHNPYSNTTVTEDYVDTIKCAFHAAGYETERILTLVKMPKGNDASVLVVANADATRARRLGYSRVYLWVQGIIPEESYMRNSSRLRSFILSRIEKKGLKSADFTFLVSHAMHTHFKDKYGMNLEDFYVMPCFNSHIDEKRFMHTDKYKNNLFLYAGGLDAWQCFDETVALYKRIEDEVPNATLRVLTKNREAAERVIRAHGVRSYSIDFRPLECMPEELEAAKFGFSLRRSHPVNHVSTPTKLSSYVSCGVIPIYSKYVKDFASISAGMKYAVASDEEDGYGIERIVELCRADIAPLAVLEEYRSRYGEYYSKDYHIKEISKIIEKR